MFASRLVQLAACLGVLGAVGAGCIDDPEPKLPATISIQLGTRQSCGLFSGLDYDTTCLQAVYVAARAIPTREVVFERCVTLTERQADLGQILRGTPLLDTGGLSARGAVTFEIRGLHDKGGADDRCADANDVANWLFWGESDPVDLSALDANGGDVVASVFVDCRDCAFDCAAGDCFGCQGIGAGTCSVELPTSFCVPGVAFRCDKRCVDDGDCFEGARRCGDDNICDTREETGELCSPCALRDGVVDGCNEGFACVGPPGATQGFCAMSCPDTFCPAGSRCNRVGNNLAVIGG